jgi:mannose/fructose/N-acetylgalactosamine-specific phosphotransferase system component IIC
LVLAALLNLERRAFAQSMLSRPLVTGTIIGLALGNLEQGLLLGLWSELLWLWQLPVGGDYTPNCGIAVSVGLISTNLSTTYLELVPPNRPLLMVAFFLIPVISHLAIYLDKFTRTLSRNLSIVLENKLALGDKVNFPLLNLWGVFHTFWVALLFLIVMVALTCLFYYWLGQILPDLAWAPFQKFYPYAPVVGLLGVGASLARPAYRPYILGLGCGFLFSLAKFC